VKFQNYRFKRWARIHGWRKMDSTLISALFNTSRSEWQGGIN